MVATLSSATVGEGQPFALSVDARTAEGTIGDDDGSCRYRTRASA